MVVGCKAVSLPVRGQLSLELGDRVSFSGRILCGRDAVLPKVCSLIAEGRALDLEADFKGAAIFHTAVSDAGVGPTSSNKVAIEESFGPLCEAGVKVFLGKGELHPETVAKLAEHNAVYAVVPPVTALLAAAMRSKRCVAFPELGMEAFYEIDLEECPAVVAAAGGKSLHGSEGR